MIKFTAQWLFIFTLIIASVLYFTLGNEVAYSCLFGGGIMLANLFGIYLLWFLVFSKKSIALAVFVIIFKYLILGAVLWNLTSIPWMRPIGLLLGFSTLLIAILSATLMKSFVKNNQTF